MFLQTLCQRFSVRCAGTRTAYNESQWYKRHFQNATCNSCLHPTCTNATCKACKTCCYTKDKAKQCTKVFPGKLQLPRNADEVACWKCPSCIYACCQVCGKENSHAKRRLARRASTSQMDVRTMPASGTPEKQQEASMSSAESPAQRPLPLYTFATAGLLDICWSWAFATADAATGLDAPDNDCRVDSVA